MSGKFLIRSRSECTLKVKHPKSKQVQGDRSGLSVSSPELCSMLVNLSTTVPQNLHPKKLSLTHKPNSRLRKGRFCCVAEGIECCGMSSCCGVRVFLVVMQIFLGCAITAISAYVHLFVPSIRYREKPLWAGVPLLLAGLFGIFFCVKEKKAEEGYSFLFVIKTVCSVLAVISIFVCVTAAVFCGIHVGQLFTYAYCKHLTNACACFQSHDPLSRSFVYTPVRDCFVVYCHVKIFIITLGSLCLVGSIVALSFVVSVWKSRYGEIAAGHRTSTV